MWLFRRKGKCWYMLSTFMLSSSKGSLGAVILIISVRHDVTEILTSISPCPRSPTSAFFAERSTFFISFFFFSCLTFDNRSSNFYKPNKNQRMHLCYAGHKHYLEKKEKQLITQRVMTFSRYWKDKIDILFIVKHLPSVMLNRELYRSNIMKVNQKMKTIEVKTSLTIRFS